MCFLLSINKNTDTVRTMIGPQAYFRGNLRPLAECRAMLSPILGEGREEAEKTALSYPGFL